MWQALQREPGQPEVLENNTRFLSGQAAHRTHSIWVRSNSKDEKSSDSKASAPATARGLMAAARLKVGHLTFQCRNTLGLPSLEEIEENEPEPVYEEQEREEGEETQEGQEE
ncbi:hypothetical protein PROFUN_03906 [Planoprotostelium fungivorum]|uniref:Uncharacterized protein n=1 Tax=Planoprotostelium fungivorum TaxID=1890364 RepID=A0A2P6MTN7_9EUKA|nr:hypothetical protein PROFUN_03906 [Planoprotostelium fungivorum]